jgi:ADP-heptose:LPS heptosyltransferase
MHIAAILKTPLVAIFGPGSLVRFDPRNISDKVVVIYKKVDCSPCNKIKCESLECLKNIYPEEVISAASSLIKSKLKH